MKKKSNGKPDHYHEFNVIWKSRNYRLASYSEHVRRGMNMGEAARVLFDSFGTHEYLVPLCELHFPAVPLPR